MINRLKSFFNAPKETETRSPDEEIRVASLALLIEVSKSDHQVDDSEQDKIISIAASLFGLDSSSQNSLLELAKQAADNSTSLYEYTSLINEHYSEKEKYTLILSMWQVAMADESIDRYEEHLIRRVADLIYVPHVQFIEAKINATSH